MLPVKPPSFAAPNQPAQPVHKDQEAEPGVPVRRQVAPAGELQTEAGSAFGPDGPAREPAPAAAPELAAPEPTDPSHWLYRLTAEQWLSAADNELQAAYQALAAKQQRAGVTYARRAAGMALNARLRHSPDAAYGRSYMEHLQALRADAAVSPELREAASRLLAVPTTQQLVTLGPRGDTTPAELAGRIIAHVRQQLTAPGRGPD